MKYIGIWLHRIIYLHLPQLNYFSIWSQRNESCFSIYLPCNSNRNRLRFNRTLFHVTYVLSFKGRRNLESHCTISKKNTDAQLYPVGTNCVLKRHWWNLEARHRCDRRDGRVRKWNSIVKSRRKSSVVNYADRFFRESP